jgi:hypothetical protein
MDTEKAYEGRREMTRFFRNRKIWEIGGIIAGVVLIGFGAASIWMGATGVNTVRDNLARENITGTGETSLDGYTVAEGELVNTGTEARAFADLMRTHALEATDGQTYAEMGRWLDESGNPTSDEAQAAVNPDTGNPVENPMRQLWVTQTALGTALNVAYFGERVAFFGVVVGVALLLAGIGFLVLALAGALRHRDRELLITPAPMPNARENVPVG